MAKVFFMRHQARGLLTDFPFAEEPTEEQQDALLAICEQTHGSAHPKTKEPYWFRVVESELLGPDEVPAVPEKGPANGPGGAVEVPRVQVSGVGHVTNPKEA